MTTTARAIARDTEAVLPPMTAITVPVSFGFGADALGTSPVYALPSGRENKISQHPEQDRFGFRTKAPFALPVSAFSERYTARSTPHSVHRQTPVIAANLPQ
jgi:hypothetical protein